MHCAQIHRITLKHTETEYTVLYIMHYYVLGIACITQVQVPPIYLYTPIESSRIRCSNMFKPGFH